MSVVPVDEVYLPSPHQILQWPSAKHKGLFSSQDECPFAFGLITNYDNMSPFFSKEDEYKRK